MKQNAEFFNLYNHGFVRVAVGTPECRVADAAFNGARTIELMKQAAKEKAIVALFPELGLSSYSCEDLFHQQALLDASLESLREILKESEALDLVTVVGMPLRVDHLLFNCAVVLLRGNILGIVPKSYLPNYREFYECRQFAPASAACRESVDVLDRREIPFGKRLLFQSRELPDLTLFVEICEDLWVPVPPSSFAALAGATVALNLSASNVTIGKDEYRHNLVGNQSARCLAAYLYTAAGTGESTTDLAWDGHAMVYENGLLLAESERFRYESHLVTADLDLERLTQDRMRQNSFGRSMEEHREEIRRFRRVPFSLAPSRSGPLPLQRQYDRFPYVPSDPAVRDRRCYEAYNIQVQGLVKRLKAAGISKVVLGISGGLDSSHALIVAARAMDVLKLPRSNILAYTMPGFGTGKHTLANARALMTAVGCSAHELDVRPGCELMLSDIGHPCAQGKRIYDVAYENVQAGERTSRLFRLANMNGALVLGTGDLSELAMGWCTYGVGDHMSHYGVNAGVPKTLIQFLIRWVADTNRLGEKTGAVLRSVLDTKFSPELVPGADDQGRPGQKTEDAIGPYELHDFFLYYTLRFGYLPSKIAFLAYSAWSDRARGSWPAVPEKERREYGIGDIKKHLSVFAYRFFQISQFKRSCVPNAPKVGSGGSLSPRGDYRAPSDGESAAWLAEINGIPDTAPPAPSSPRSAPRGSAKGKHR